MHLSSVRHLLLSCQTSVLRGNIVFPKRLISSTSALSQSTRKILDDSDENTRKTKKEITDLPEKEIYPEYVQPAKGVVYDKKPFKYECIEGKAYVWCSCGRSHKQPFCDGTHKNKHLRITLRPVRWDCTETKEYWFCNCKQTKHPPFCDGTHKAESIQKGHSTVRDVHSPIVVPEKIKKK
ncbi:CDGSH-type zinc finger [Tyrophagus putrescentiae]|nr:CDGSH-type zinc finger [Tyrophagus putrescentiae]